MSPGRQRRIDAARGVGDDQRPHAERGGDADAEADLAGRVALVAVHAPAQQQRRLARDRAGDEASGMPGDGRLRESRAATRRARRARPRGDRRRRPAPTRAPPRRRRRPRQLLGHGAGGAPHAVEQRRVQLHSGDPRGSRPPRDELRAAKPPCVRRAPARLRERVDEGRHGVQERAGRLDVGQVAGAGDRDEAGAGDRRGDLAHLGGGRHLVLGAAQDQRRTGDGAQLGRSVGAVAQRLDPGAQAGRAGLCARRARGRPARAARAATAGGASDAAR